MGCNVLFDILSSNAKQKQKPKPNRNQNNNTMRYILDIADPTGAHAKEFMEEICETMADHIITIVCIDETNTNQFHDDSAKNTLTDAQLQRYTDYCHSEE